jgi:hypothetical protein
VYSREKSEKQGHCPTQTGSTGLSKCAESLSNEFASVQVVGRGCAVDEGSPRFGRKLTLIEATP